MLKHTDFPRSCWHRMFVPFEKSSRLQDLGCYSHLGKLWQKEQMPFGDAVTVRKAGEGPGSLAPLFIPIANCHLVGSLKQHIVISWRLYKLERQRWALPPGLWARIAFRGVFSIWKDLCLLAHVRGFFQPPSLCPVTSSDLSFLFHL